MREFADVLFESARLERDFRLVSYDQRGTGYSGLIRCPALERDPRLRSTRGRRGVRGAARRAARLYGTRDSVEDIEALRRALGVEQADAVRHLLRHEARARLRARPPEHVARIALDSVLDPDDAEASGSSRTARWRPTLERAVPGRRCVSADPAADLARLVERLRRAPMRGLVYRLRGGARGGRR